MMQQKDTIILAVLINLAILSSLFMFASQQKDVKDEIKQVAVAKKQVSKQRKKTSRLKKVATQESINDVLKNYQITKKQKPTAESKKVVVTKEKKAPPKKKQEEYYTVKSGDNPWTISKKFSVGFDELLKMNNLDEKKARKLNPGDKVRVR